METCIINIILYNFQIKLKIFEIKRKSANYKATHCRTTQRNTAGDTCPENPDLHQQKQNRVPNPESRFPIPEAEKLVMRRCKAIPLAPITRK